MNMTFNTYYEQLVYEVNVLKRYSAESEFTAYLDTVLNRLLRYHLTQLPGLPV